MDKLDELAAFLYEKETITGEEFMKILKGDEVEEAQAEEAEQRLLADEQKDEAVEEKKAAELKALEEEHASGKPIGSGSEQKE